MTAVVAPALLESKFRIPSRRPVAIARPRLTERLGAAMLTVVSAPAGFGKTTLLTEWLATTDPSAVAWLSLDDRDNDPVLFWAYVVTAMRRAVDGIGEAALQLLTSAAASTEAGLAALLNDLDGLAAELVLVLDDYHLIEAAEVHQALTFLLEHSPPRLHLVLATRVDPPLPLARLRARGQLVEVLAADLRFTAQESAAYLNGPMRLGLSEADVTALDGRTEGWIAALQLAALSIQGREDATAFIAGFAGDDRYIVDYLAEEVLARQRPEVRDFLLETSVLERLTGPLCDAVTVREGSKAMLVALERANLFLVPLDDRREWYRYHHLFGDVLQAHLLDERGEHVVELHRRAAGWLAANGDPPQAIRHALAGNDFGRAADLMERSMPLMRRQRQEAELARWIRALPEEVVRKRPVLALAFVGALAQVSNFDEVGRRLSDLEACLRSADGSWPEQPPAGLIVVDEAGYRSLPAGVELFRAALALAAADLASTMAHAGQALSLAPVDDRHIRAAASALAGLAAWASGDLAAAHTAYTATVDGLTRDGSFADVLGCCIALGDLCRTRGRLHEALRTYQQALELTAPKPGAEPLRGTADMHVAIADILLERDDRSAAADQLARSERLGEHNGLPQNPYRRRLVAARLREADGDLDGALTLLDEADRVYHGDYSPNVRPVPAVRARLRLRRGELGHAEAWAAERQLAADDELSYLREYEHITLARLLLARHRIERDDTALDGAESDETALDQALLLLDRLLAAAEAGGRTGSAIELLILMALAQQSRGELPAALATLQRAVSRAEPEGYLRLFAEEGPAMASLLQALAKRSAPSGYLRRLLDSTAGTAPAANPNRSLSPNRLVEPLSERELDVLRLLGSDLDGPDIARELSVSLNTVRTHTKNIYAKLGVTSRRAAVRRGQELDLLGRRR